MVWMVQTSGLGLPWTASMVRILGDDELDEVMLLEISVESRLERR